MLRTFVSDRSGNFAMIAALAIVPVVGAVALAVDYSDASNVRTRVQLIGDSAILAGTNEARTLVGDGVTASEATRRGEQVANAFFEAQAQDFVPRVSGTFTPDIAYNNGAFEGTGSFSGGVPTSFAKIFKINQMPIDTVSVANISGQQFNDIHVLIDVSASMGVGATSSDVSIMAGAINCAFACHTPPGFTSWPNSIHDARAAGARLRIDVVRSATIDLIDNLQALGLGDSLRVGIHTFSNSLQTVVPATSDLDQVRNGLSSIDLAAVWGQGGTDFAEALSSVHAHMGASGSGMSANDRIKTLVVMTDGVSTNLQYDKNGWDQVDADPNYTPSEPRIGTGAWAMQGFDERACEPLKREGINIMTVNVEYVIPTVGTSNDDRFEQIGQILKPDIGRKMERCASRRAFAMRANDPRQIERAMDDVLENLEAYTLRLTN